MEEQNKLPSSSKQAVSAPRRAVISVRAAAVNTSSYAKVEKVRERKGEESAIADVQLRFQREKNGAAQLAKRESEQSRAEQSRARERAEQSREEQSTER